MCALGLYFVLAVFLLSLLQMNVLPLLVWLIGSFVSPRTMIASKYIFLMLSWPPQSQIMWDTVWFRVCYSSILTDLSSSFEDPTIAMQRDKRIRILLIV